MTHSALIVDDEPLARRKLRELLADIPAIEVLGEATDGEEAVRAIDGLRPDIVLLDIEMPALSGLAVVDEIEHQPAIIFTTAYDRYAVTAFEVAAVDYLLKPFGRDRLRKAIERAIHSLAASTREPGSEPLQRTREALAPDAPLRRVFVRDGGKVVPLSVREVERLEARDDYVAVHVRDRTFLLHVPLQSLEDRLDPELFVRIHRSHLVNLDYVRAFSAYDGSRLLIEMRDGAKLIASRSRSRELRSLIE